MNHIYFYINFQIYVFLDFIYLFSDSFIQSFLYFHIILFSHSLYSMNKYINKHFSLFKESGKKKLTHHFQGALKSDVLVSCVVLPSSACCKLSNTKRGLFKCFMDQQPRLLVANVPSTDWKIHRYAYNNKTAHAFSPQTCAI